MKNTRLSTKFKEFREKGIFIDCCFKLPGGEIIKAHRLILSEYSTVFKHYFQNNEVKSETEVLEIPFITDSSTFTKMIDFCYTGEIEIEPDTMISIMASAYMLGFTSIKTIVIDYIRQNINTDFLLNYTRPFLNFSVDEERGRIYPDLYENFELLKEGSKILSAKVAERFSHFLPEAVCGAVPSYMLSHILTIVQLTEEDIEGFPSENDFKIYLIDQYVKQRELSFSDRETLTNIIDWNSPDSYLYFVRHDCNWVLPEVSRVKISEVISKRRSSVHAVDQTVSNCKKEKVHHLAFYQLIQLIVDSLGQTEVPFINIIKSFGTLFDAVQQFNPEKFRLFMPSIYTHPPMTPNYAVSNMFVDDSKYYFTQSDYYRINNGKNYVHNRDHRVVLTTGIDFEISDSSNLAYVECKQVMIRSPKNINQPIEFSFRFNGSDEVVTMHNPKIYTSPQALVASDFQHSKSINMINISARQKSTNLGFCLRVAFFEINGRFLLEE